MRYTYKHINENLYALLDISIKNKARTTTFLELSDVIHINHIYVCSSHKITIKLYFSKYNYCFIFI